MTTAFHFVGGLVIDPTHNINAIKDIWICDAQIYHQAPTTAHQTIVQNCQGKVLMAGGVDMHTHIGGGKVNIARALLPEESRQHSLPSDLALRCVNQSPTPSTLSAGYQYALMGYTACFEPAMLPANARQAHLEMGDTPIVDHGAYALLGNDDFLLRALAAGKPQQYINDYVAWTMHATQALAIKIVNPGGISAFKFNQRHFELDSEHSHYKITPRRILQSLARAVREINIPHALHVHASNLGAAGNFATTLATMEAVEGLPLHLTHIQFHSYGTEGELKFSSQAVAIAEAVNRNKNISIDIGQVLFGQTVTCSADTMAQHLHAHLASPRKSVCMDIECDAGCGVVPFRYRDQSFVNALQWSIGLELFLLVEDPWRIVLTTDHPNGAPFTFYPHLIRLLTDKSFRDEQLARLHPLAQKLSSLASIQREYSLAEIAIITRAAPSRLLGLHELGHLGNGARANLVVYEEQADREAMFAHPLWVFKNGVPIVQEGKIVATVPGDVHVCHPEYDAAIKTDLKNYFNSHMTQQFSGFAISNDELTQACNPGGTLNIHTCSRTC